jgi:hypothetical protein
MKTIPFLLVFLLFVIGCKKDKEPENPYTSCPYGKSFTKMDDNMAIRTGLIPFTLGSLWIYADSTWKGDTLISSGIDTVRVVSAERSGDDIWWKLSDGYRLCVSNDSIYKLNINGMVLDASLICPEKTLLFYPIPKDTVIEWHETSGDIAIAGEASVYREVIHTGIGDYQDCMKYSFMTFDQLTRYIEPGTGIIKTTQYFADTRQTKIRTLMLHLMPISK